MLATLEAEGAFIRPRRGTDGSAARLSVHRTRVRPAPSESPSHLESETANDGTAGVDAGGGGGMAGVEVVSGSGGGGGGVSFADLWAVRRQLVLGVGLLVLQQIIGINTIMYYSVSILLQAHVSQHARPCAMTTRPC